MRVTLFSLALIATSMGFAQSFSNALSFTPEPGVRELSGRLIVRPKQLMNLANTGVSPATAYQTSEASRNALAQYTLRYIPETDEYILQVPKGLSDAALAAKLAGQGQYEYIEPDWIVYPTTIPNDPMAQWHIPKVDAYNAWSLYTAQTTNIVVAITDTGIRQDHEEFVGRLVSGANSATGTAIAQSSGGLVEDLNGHGTHCAGIAAATTNNAKGVCGAGWGLKIMPVRVSDSSGGGSSSAALAAGARWAADNGARVVSTSYSGVSSATNQTTGAYLRSKNVLYCFAAGNSNTNLSSFDHLDVTVVGATDSNDAKASFSSYGLATDVYAPGVNILSTYRTSATSYSTLSGTSMATPLAAGIATTVAASNPSITSQQLENALYFSCDDLGPVGNDTQWGWGRVNLNKALRYAYNKYSFPTFTATSVQGISAGDALSALNTSDDQYWRVNSDQWVTVRLRFKSTLLLINSMQLILEDQATAEGGTICTVSTGGTGQKLDVRPVAGSDVLRTINVPLTAIEPGTGDIVLDVTYMPFSRTLPQWQAKIDHAVLFTKPL